MEEGKLRDKEFEEILRKGFQKISKGNITANFIPILVANNQFEGGLGPSRFHVINECGIEKEKLLGRTPITEQDFVTFYSRVAKEVPRLRFGSERIKKTIEFVDDLFKKQTEFSEMIGDLLRFFEKVDKDKSGYLDKDEIKGFFEEMSKKEMEKDPDTDTTAKESERAFHWVDKNKSGTIDLYELISITMSKTMLEKSKSDWYSYLSSLGIKLQFH